jgi:translation initiation factor 3 subunit I
MRPILLHGHERSITQICYNYDGDLLFSVAKDNRPTVWYSENGERLGTYNGHNGAVWCIDVNVDSTQVLTGAGDDTVKLWDCELGKEVRNWNTASAVRTCAFTHLGDLIMFTTDERSATPCELFVYDLRANEDPITVIPMETNRKVTAALWGPLDQFIVTGHADGSICHYDHKVSKCIKQVREHKEAVSDLQLNHDMTMIISSSKDTTAMVRGGA